MRLLEALNAEYVLYWRESHLLKDFSRSDSLILEKFLRTEVLRHAMPSLQTHIFALFVHKLVCTTPLTSLYLTWLFTIHFLGNGF